MSGKWPGGIISKTAPTVTGPTGGEGGSASGIWTLDQVADYEKQGLCPKPGIPRGLWTWGYNTRGQLGLGDLTVRSSPVQVGALLTWTTQFSSGLYHAGAVRNDGTLWTWGDGGDGQLGDGTLVNKSSPVQVGALTDWSKLAGTRQGFLSIKTDGTLWAWGKNDHGQLGDGATANKSSPVQIGALTDWLQVSGGDAISFAVKTDGTLWSWGYGNNGALGQNNTTAYSSPVQVGALTTWAVVGCSSDGNGCAIRTDGTLWTWGNAHAGGLGDGSTVNKSSPVQVGALTTWSKVTFGRNWGAAIKTDGTLWAWGYNGMGQVAQGNTTDYSSPVQVGALTNWSTVVGINNGGIAFKTDGTIWTWGRGDEGELGDGTAVSKSSPVQVGALTSWIATLVGSAGGYSSGALRS